MKFKFMLFMIIAACLISSVSAEVINETTILVHDFTDESIGYAQSGVNKPYHSYLDRFLCYNIESSGGLERIIFNVDVQNYKPTTALDQYGIIDITLRIGSVEVGNGIMEYERSGYSTTTKLYNRISCSIEISNYDVSEYTGKQTIEFYETGNKNSAFIGNVQRYPQFDDYVQEDSGIGTFYLAVDSPYPPHIHVCAKYSIQIDRKEDFYQHLTYSVDENNNIATAYYRENRINVISLSSDDGVYYYNAEESTDIPTIVLVNKTYAEYKIWMPLSLEIKTIRIPEIELPPVTPTPEIPEEQTAIIHSTVYDAVTRNLINGFNTTLTYDDNSAGVLTTWPGHTAYTTIDWSDALTANLSFSAPGYADSCDWYLSSSSLFVNATWIPVGTEIDQHLVYLDPLTPPSNTTFYTTFGVLEELSEDNYFMSDGASVTVGDTTMITSGLTGSCSFVLPTGSYSYTVKKSGFQTVSGSFTVVSSNVQITVKIPKIATAPTPTGDPGIDYPYTKVDPYSEAEESMGIIFSSLPAWAGLCVLVVTMSFIGWLKPKK